MSRWLAAVLCWSWRKGTTAAQKLPIDWQQQADLFVLRLAYMVKMFDVPKALVINFDQTGMKLVPTGSGYTYHLKGAKDVPIVGAEDKRGQSLLCLVVSNNMRLNVFDIQARPL